MGSSSVSYEVGFFEQGNETSAAVGGYTHVFVDRDSRKSMSMGESIRGGLAKLLHTQTKL